MSNQATYFYEEEVKEYQCDVNGKMKLSYLMKAIQQAGTAQLNSLGITYDKMYATGIVFVLSKMGIKINRMPKFNEKIMIRTTPQKTKGASFLRHTALFDTNGVELVECQTAWVIINPKERKILRPSAFKFTLPYCDDDNTGFQVLETRIKKVENPNTVGIKNVKYSDLDINKHMNNTYYGDIISDNVPYEIMSKKDIDTVIIYFENEAKFNENISINVNTLEENTFYIGGKIDNIKCFESVISFK